MAAELLSVDGIVLSKCEHWDYTVFGCGENTGEHDARLKDLNRRPGQMMTLTVTPGDIPDFGHLRQL